MSNPKITFPTQLSYPTDIDGTLAANSDSKIATQKAVKTYVGNRILKTGDIVTGTYQYNSNYGATKFYTGGASTNGTILTIPLTQGYSYRIEADIVACNPNQTVNTSCKLTGLFYRTGSGVFQSGNTVVDTQSALGIYYFTISGGNVLIGATNSDSQCTTNVFAAVVNAGSAE